MKTAIRPIEATDVPAVSRLVSACYRFLAERQGFSSRQLKELLNDRSSEPAIRHSNRCFERYVAEVGGETVGLLGLDGNDISDLFVAPSFHRRGVGRLLFEEAEELIGSRGHEALTVRTTGFAIPFYEAMGARIVAREPCPDGPLKGWTLTYFEKRLAS